MNKISIIFSIIGIILLFCFAFWGITTIGQSSRLQTTADRVLDSESENIDIDDIWGNTIICEYGVSEDRTYRYAKVTSIGYDGELGTWDDTTLVKRDYNKSRIMGAYIGQRAQEALEGLAEGLEKKSKFKE